MENKNEPGIRLLSVFISKLNFDTHPAFPQQRGLSLAMDLNHKFTQDDTRLETLLTIDLWNSEKREESPFNITATVVGLFEEIPGGAVTLKKFAEINAPSILFPYLREAVSSITAKSHLGSVLLPPVNIAALIRGERHTIESEFKVANG